MTLVRSREELVPVRVIAVIAGVDCVENRPFCFLLHQGQELSGQIAVDHGIDDEHPSGSDHEAAGCGRRDAVPILADGVVRMDGEHARRQLARDQGHVRGSPDQLGVFGFAGGRRPLIGGAGGRCGSGGTAGPRLGRGQPGRQGDHEECADQGGCLHAPCSSENRASAVGAPVGRTRPPGGRPSQHAVTVPIMATATRSARGSRPSIARDAQLFHPEVEVAALCPDGGGAVGAGDHPVGLVQGMWRMLGTLHILQHVLAVR